MRSLRAELLAWVLLPLAAAVAVDGVITYGNASDAASVVQDRLLLGSARIIAEQLRFEEGEFQNVVPPSALELFESSHEDRIYYRVTTESGQLLSGYGELDLPAAPQQPELPHFFYTTVRSLPVRAVAFLQPLVGEPGVQPVLVEIAQTLRGRTLLTRSLWLHAVSQQLLILLLTTILVLFGLHRGLRPLLSLRDMVLSRAPGTLELLEVNMLPRELVPLVEAMNDYAKRLAHYTGAQRAFVQNAAHQLRTPLTLLNTQVSYALRTTDTAAREESLLAIRLALQHAIRLVNQLLILSSAEADVSDEEKPVAIRIDSIVQEVLENFATQAQRKDIDLGFELFGDAPQVWGHPVALREIVLNLVDNAIQYTPAGGVITTRITMAPGSVTLTVEDNGPGISVEERERVFERFYRIDDRDSRGSGLGLPIVREFAFRIGATVRLDTGPGGVGLAATVTFPAPPPEAADTLPENRLC
jgi:two-component system sensor histidine kinase TctE